MNLEDIKYGLTPQPTGITREEILKAFEPKIPKNYILKLAPLPWGQRAWGADNTHIIQFKEDKRNGASILKLKLKDGYPPTFQSNRMGNTVVTTYAKSMPTHHYNRFRLKLKTKSSSNHNWKAFETKRISFRESIEQLPELIIE